jgi:hypothetical protein
MAENKIEQYLIDLKLSYEEIGHNIWFLDDSDNGFEGIAIMLNEPLVVFRSTLMDIPKDNQADLFTKLLELNASDLIHGAYAIQAGKVILVDTLEYENMDTNEFRATLDAFSLAMTQHYPVLSKFRS